LITRRRIGEVLLSEGRISQDQLQAALAEQKQTGELLGAILYGHGWITREDLSRVLALSQAQNGGTQGATEQVDIPPELEGMVRQCLAISRSEGSGERPSPDGAQSPLVRLVEKIIIHGIKRNATDVHVGPDTNGARIRYRIDGALQHGMCLPKELLGAIVLRFKILGQMNIAENRVPQDGSAKFYFDDRNLDLRISSFPLVNGENIVARILDKSQLCLGLDRLGFAEVDVESIHQSLKRPYGMILVTGPTGSGKTTTLYSCLTTINTVSRNIFTIEDPVEYQVPLVRQAQVNVKAGLTFAAGLRSMLRQDPDILLVGEMRDHETAELAVRAALTGHMVFSTLHTNDALASVFRLMDMGIEPFLISSTLDTIIAQRLVRVLCEACRAVLPPSHVLYERLGLDPAKRHLYGPRGCVACGNTGYRGRTTIYEILKISPEMRDFISRKPSLDDLRRLAAQTGFHSMAEIGLAKVRAGITSLEEISTVTRTED
jgi:type IV pilus assembly protein PilB